MHVDVQQAQKHRRPSSDSSDIWELPYALMISLLYPRRWHERYATAINMSVLIPEGNLTLEVKVSVAARAYQDIGCLVVAFRHQTSTVERTPMLGQS